MDSQLKICPKCGKVVSYKYHFHRYVCDECGWEEDIPEVSDEETPEDKRLRELFLDKVCRKYPCGSQRCDGGPEWITGCSLYKEFIKGIDALSEQLLNK